MAADYAGETAEDVGGADFLGYEGCGARKVGGGCAVYRIGFYSAGWEVVL